MEENSPIFMKCRNCHNQEDQQTQVRKSQEIHTDTNNNQMLKTKDNERILKKQREGDS